MRVLFLATGSVAIPSFRWLLSSNHEVVAVVTQPDRPSGRGRQIAPSQVKQMALYAGVELIQPEKVNDPRVVEKLLSLHPDVAITASFGQLIGQTLLDGLPGRWINIHPSLLPKYRGAAPVNWAIIRREAKTGVTIFALNRRMDAGSILVVRETMIKPAETSGELQERLARVAPDALKAALELFVSGQTPPGQPQDDALSTPAPKLTKDMGDISLSLSAGEIAAWVNGLYPWPGVHWLYTSADGQRRVEIRAVRAIDSPERIGATGVSCGTILDDGSIACGDGAFDLLELQPAGGRIMTWQDFVNGRRVKPGDQFLRSTKKPPTP